MAPDPLVFGVTLDQLDILHRLVRTIAAHGDVIAIGAGASLDVQTLPALGDAIYDAAIAARHLLEQVGEQRLASATVSTMNQGEDAHG